MFWLTLLVMLGCLGRRATGVAAFSASRPVSKMLLKSSRSQVSHGASLTPSLLQMSTTTAETTILPRIKAADATGPSNGPVLVKGWVRTVRKQKTLAFVEVNDGSNLGGIQCVLSFDAIDDQTQAGT